MYVAAAVVRQHQAGAGLGEARQVIKIAVVPVGKITVAVARAFRCRRDDGDAAGTELGRQAGTTFLVNHGQVFASNCEQPSL